jgi:hypothetical protein
MADAAAALHSVMPVAHGPAPTHASVTMQPCVTHCRVCWSDRRGNMLHETIVSSGVTVVSPSTLTPPPLSVEPSGI